MHPLLTALHPPSPGSRVLVAVSGGADSLALLHALHTQRERWNLTLAAWHLHHGLRGAQADADAALVAAHCATWGVPLTAQRADVAALARERREGLEAAGRRARYTLLAQAATAGGFTHVAVAHTRTDQLETVLLHLARGSGLRGLGGMMPERPLCPGVTLIRPLLDCPRDAVESYCAAQGIRYAVDASNADVRFARNRLRHQATPALRAVNPGAEAAVARLARLAREDEAYLCAQSTAALDACATPEGYDAATLAVLPPPLRRRALRAAWARLMPSGELSQAQLEAADAVLCGRERTAVLVGDVEVRLRRGTLTLTRLSREKKRRGGDCAPPNGAD